MRPIKERAKMLREALAPWIRRDLTPPERDNLNTRTEMAVGAIRGEALTHAMQENKNASNRG